MINQQDGAEARTLAALADKLDELAARVRATPPSTFAYSDARGVTSDDGDIVVTRSLDGSAYARVEIAWPPGTMPEGRENLT